MPKAKTFPIQTLETLNLLKAMKVVPTKWFEHDDPKIKAVRFCMNRLDEVKESMLLKLIRQQKDVKSVEFKGCAEAGPRLSGYEVLYTQLTKY